jgi:hypothetical protein
MGGYLLLVDYTGRLFCDRMAAISAQLSDILERLGSKRGAAALSAGTRCR